MEAAAHGHSKLGIPEAVGKEFVAADSADKACAGIIFRAQGPLYLLVQRSENGQWEQPGGHLEEGESLEECAVRECVEEIGGVPDGDRWVLRTSRSDGIAYTCYLQDAQPFEPTLNHEHTNFRWSAPDDLPENTHPEVVRSIQLITGHELTIAKAIRAGELSSPQKYENVWLFAVRVTGTGTSYRKSLDEYVYRPPEDFLTEEFVERCNGLPLIFEHPERSILNTDEYRDRAIGTVILPYIQTDEVWGIAKVFDADGAHLMMTTHASTSPAVVFRDAGSTETITLNDGKTVLVEGKPSLLDHLAICEEGVWDKGGEPTGVKIEGDSPVENEEKVPAWADALNERLDAMCSRMDSIENKGGDTFGDARKDEAEKEKKDEKKDASRKDGEEKAEKAEKEEKKDSGDEMLDSEKGAEKAGEKEEKAEKEALKEGEKEREEERSDERKDSQARAENKELRTRIADMDARLSSLTKPLSAADRDALSVAQARADSLAQMFGDSVNAPLHGESPIAYRKRLATKFQKHSTDMKTVRLDSLDGAAFALVEDRIYADAQKFAMSPAQMPAGRLQAHVRADAAGRQITTYTGDIDGWMNHFKSPGMVATINRNHGKGAN